MRACGGSLKFTISIYIYTYYIYKYQHTAGHTLYTVPSSSSVQRSSSATGGKGTHRKRMSGIGQDASARNVHPVELCTLARSGRNCAGSFQLKRTLQQRAQNSATIYISRTHTTCTKCNTPRTQTHRHTAHTRGGSGGDAQHSSTVEMARVLHTSLHSISDLSQLPNARKHGTFSSHDDGILARPRVSCVSVFRRRCRQLCMHALSVHCECARGPSACV